MTNETGATAQRAPSELGKVLSFRGRLGRRQYLLWLLAELALLLVGIAGLASLNNPTGGPSAAPLAIVFPLAALYLHFCIVPARLRDAGVRSPILLGLLVALLPFLWLALMAELIERLWPVVLIGFAALYFGPGLPKSEAAEPPQS